MKKDINIPSIDHVHIAVARKEEDDWSLYIVNRSNAILEDAMVVSKGYGERNGEKVKTSTLRHYIGSVGRDGNAVIEKIDPALFILTHELWLTFYIDGIIHDKKFIFTPSMLSEKNLLYIKELDMYGIL